MGYLLSYPRSGNHLARAFIEYLTRRPTTSYYRGDMRRDRLPIWRQSDVPDRLDVDPAGTPEYVKVHGMAWRLAHSRAPQSRHAIDWYQSRTPRQRVFQTRPPLLDAFARYESVVAGR